jgi:hypothetical protein
MLLSTTVVGLRKNKNEVDRLVDDLQVAGISKNTIRVVDENELRTHESMLAGDMPTHRATGIVTLLKRLYSAEGGMEVEPVSPLYTEWVQDGGYLIAVNTDERHADNVRQIMESYGDAEATARTTKAELGQKTAGPFISEPLKEPVTKAELREVEAVPSLDTHQERITDFRNDFSARFGRLGRSYSEYAPAYELGSTLAMDERYRNRDWNDIEFEARRQWDAKGQGSWKDFRDAVRYGWEKSRRKAA